MESILHVLHQPIVPFAILLAVILIVPMLFERLRVPGLVGLLAAGVILGPNALGLLDTEDKTMQLLSDIGLVYLMFVAGLEVDIAQFRKTKHRSIGFGTYTFLVPMIVGTAVGRLFAFDWNASVLIGSLFASHTLLAYPIVSRLGVVANEAITVTIGATIFTDIGALLVLAVCVGIHKGDFTAAKLFTLLASLIVYSALVLFGLDWAGKEFFRRSGNEEGNQFLFVLLALFLASLGAELIGVEKIVGAFLAGLAVNDVLGEGPVKEKVLFVGSVLFIPIFFVDMGLLIDIPAFIKTLSSVWLTLAIVLGLIGSKFLAALFAKLTYRYTWQEMLAMWSLSLPQVAATLAATLVGYRVGLLTEGVLNSVLVLMLVTATLGPVITSRVAVGLSVPETRIEDDIKLVDWESTSVEHPFRVVVPLSNPQTEQHLIEMAALLARHEGGRIVPLAIAHAHAHMDAPQLEMAFQRGEMLIERAKDLSLKLGVTAEGLVRLDDKIAQGISRASREQKASLIVMGWGNRTGLRARLFGNVIDSVLWASHCPVAVTRLLGSPSEIRRILVPVENLTEQAVRPVRFAEILAASNQAEVILFHVCNTKTKPSKIAWMRSQLSLIVSKSAPNCKADIQILPHENVAQAILTASKSVDLIVLRSIRQRTAGGLEISDVTTQLIQQLTCSILMLGEPRRPSTVAVPNQPSSLVDSNVSI
ncbi:cation:proton antiporter [Microcoleus sp. FACHB-831]|uniref:cation:proton antiporter domain-containing protein n=1 Tax=Microcoleus sp. FACHB-831 TaxID=2692827 RepID=UPI001689E42B|nr:cation:proton antiporter [Microcoleus sp. FACHB-831]MBD1924574.1 cation:proton antiporter [Microcoleus sp. FACHB-831]